MLVNCTLEITSFTNKLGTSSNNSSAHCLNIIQRFGYVIGYKNFETHTLELITEINQSFLYLQDLCLIARASFMFVIKLLFNFS